MIVRLASSNMERVDRYELWQARQDAERKLVAFSGAVPLDGHYVMQPHVMAGPLLFTPLHPLPCGTCKVIIVASGLHVPQFHGFHVAGGQFDNRPGRRTLLEFSAWSAELLYVGFHSRPQLRGVK